MAASLLVAPRLRREVLTLLCVTGMPVTPDAVSDFHKGAFTVEVPASASTPFPSELSFTEEFSPDTMNGDNWYRNAQLALYRSFVPAAPGTLTQDCELVIEEPTYFTQRYYPGNMYHASLVFVTYWEVMRTLGVLGNLVTMDNHSPSEVDNMWSLLGVKKLYRSQELPARTCFKKIILLSSEYVVANGTI